MIYTALPLSGYFRILSIHPRSNEEPIECKLEAACLDHAADTYEALSYVWGDIEDTESIFCNGESVTVRRNLADALRAFRRRDESRRIWADALCINQQDIDERGEQVKQMGKVYANARRALIWLGRDEQDHAGEAFRSITEVNRFFDRQFVERGCLEPWQLPLLTNPTPLRLTAETWTAMTQFFKLQWFERLWVVQELALAKESEMWWGQHTIDTAQVFEYAGWHCTKPDFRSLEFDLRTRRPWMLFWQIYSQFTTRKDTWQCSLPLLRFQASLIKKHDFVQVLHAASDLEATDPRDRVYALLGSSQAMDQERQPLINVDYRMAVKEVYLQVACALLKQKGTAINVLACVHHPNIETFLSSPLPSWVPDWNRPNSEPEPCSQDTWYQAGGPIDSFSAHVDGDSLRVKCLLFDEIIWTSDILKTRNFMLNPDKWDDEVRRSGRPFIDQLMDNVFAQDAVHIDEDDFIRVLARGFPKNFVTFQYTHKRFNRRDFDLYRRYVRAVAAKNENVRHEISDAEYSEVIQVERLLMSVCTKRFAVFDTGRVGFVPGAASRVGDWCCIIPGVVEPFILTYVGDYKFKLVGRCFIDGVMYGEIANYVKSGHTEMVEVNII